MRLVVLIFHWDPIFQLIENKIQIEKLCDWKQNRATKFFSTIILVSLGSSLSIVFAIILAISPLQGRHVPAVGAGVGDISYRDKLAITRVCPRLFVVRDDIDYATG